MHVEMNKMFSVLLLSFPKITFDIEYYESKSRMMHAN